MSDRVAVGVDAGGTSTVAAVGREGLVVRTARGPGANATTLGVDDAADVILSTVRSAVERDVPGAIYIGAAGAGRAAVARTLEALIQSGFPRAKVTVGDDGAIALRAAVPQGPGIALIAGTGSTAFADSGTQTFRVGGLGYLAGDEGSAYAIGFAAVKLLGLALDGRARTDETVELVKRALSVETRDDFVARIYDERPDPAKIAALAPAIVAFAGKGNRAARTIVERAGEDLADLVYAAAERASLLEAVVPIVFAGGLLRERSALCERVEARLRTDLPRATIVRKAEEAYAGALRLAQASLDAEDSRVS